MIIITIIIIKLTLNNLTDRLFLVQEGKEVKSRGGGGILEGESIESVQPSLQAWYVLYTSVFNSALLEEQFHRYIVFDLDTSAKLVVFAELNISKFLFFNFSYPISHLKFH